MQHNIYKKHSAAHDQFALLLREHEVQIVTGLLGDRQKKILEIGGGNGWQAHLLHKQGYDVTSIDISPQTGSSTYFPVLKYDGHQIPFKDSLFDVVFSSNVLEHIAHLDKFEQELHRVLAPEGIAIHVLPTSAWRFWTSITHPFQVIRALRRILPGGKRYNTGKTGANDIKKSWHYAFWPNRHGEKGNSFSEIYWFSQTAWSRHFKNTGWDIIHIGTSRLFYTGQLVLNSRLPITTRKTMAKYLGAATKVYILKQLSIPDQKYESDNHDPTSI